MVLRHSIVNCKSELFTQFSKDWNGSLWSLRREEVTHHSADWHFNSLLYSDVLLQLLLSLFFIWRVWGGFVVVPIPSAFKTLWNEMALWSDPVLLLWFDQYVSQEWGLLGPFWNIPEHLIKEFALRKSPWDWSEKLPFCSSQVFLWWARSYWNLGGT